MRTKADEFFGGPAIAIVAVAVVLGVLAVAVTSSVVYVGPVLFVFAVVCAGARIVAATSRAGRQLAVTLFAWAVIPPAVWTTVLALGLGGQKAFDSESNTVGALAAFVLWGIGARVRESLDSADARPADARL